MDNVYDRKEACCGCAACADICPSGSISMVEDEEGFLYPFIDDSTCIDCGLCRRVCAFVKAGKMSGSLNEPKVFAAKHKDDKARLGSTSGGAFTAISDAVLAKGGAVYGAKLEGDFSVRHVRAIDGASRDCLRGSKYAQSDAEGAYNRVAGDLAAGTPVMFTGLPCQADALKRFVRLTGADFVGLLLVDLICYGAYSVKLLKEHISHLEALHGKKASGYRFRPKEFGWSGNREEVTFEDGSTDSSSEDSQLLKGLFLSRLILRPSCYECPYAGKRRHSDITIGDYWGAGRRFSDLKDELGVSVILLNTGKGACMLDDIGNTMEMRESDMADCSRKQPSLNGPAANNPRRAAFWADLMAHGYASSARRHLGVINKQDKA